MQATSRSHVPTSGRRLLVQRRDIPAIYRVVMLAERSTEAVKLYKELPLSDAELGFGGPEGVSNVYRAALALELVVAGLVEWVPLHEPDDAAAVGKG